jgi:hypothetical protein
MYMSECQPTKDKWRSMVETCELCCKNFGRRLMEEIQIKTG